MTRLFLTLAAVVLCSVLTATEKPIQCTLFVSPLRGDSRVTKSGGGSLCCRSSSLSDNGTKTIERSLKWKVDVRFRERKPAKVELKVHYIGYGNGGKDLTVIAAETKAVELDENGRASVELTSPKTRLTRTRTRTSNGSSGGFSSTKSRTTGEQVAGCVLQLLGDGALVKSWSSESRWSAAADSVPFSIQELKQKSGRIGLR